METEKTTRIGKERILYMADNKKFKAERQKVKELTEKLEEGMKQIFEGGSIKPAFPQCQSFIITALTTRS